MSSVVKRSISLPTELFDALEGEAAAEGRTVSSIVSEATERWLATRRGIAAVRAWERDHGELTQEELAAADDALDRAGLGRNR
ncbi:MAG: hypothetical protein ABMA25_08075 [Ilumatobacteraceae bacterium]